MTNDTQRSLAALSVACHTKRNIIDTVEGYYFSSVVAAQNRKREVRASAAVSALGIVLAIFVAWQFLILTIGGGAAWYVLTHPKKVEVPRRYMECQNSYSGLMSYDRRDFVRLAQLQNEIYGYLKKNTVADLYVERFNNLTAQANEVLGTLVVFDLQPREDKRMLDTAHPRATDLAGKFDQLYNDLLRQAELDPTATKYGQVLESMKNLELRGKDREEREYGQLRSSYNTYMERTATDSRDYYDA